MPVYVPISFEFFPPKSEAGLDKLLGAAVTLKQYDPQYCSVTFGAGGSTQTQTPETVYALQKKLNLSVAPHISCVSSTEQQLRLLLEDYLAHDVTRLVVLRGDRPSGQGYSEGAFQYASDLVSFIRSEFGDRFELEVGCYPECHPESEDFLDDFKHFQHKVNAGADSAITQYFYNVESYCHFKDSCEKAGMSIPIVPGIMPIQNFANIQRFSQRCGAEIPRWLFKKMMSFNGDPVAMQAFGIEVVAGLCDRLLQAGAPGLHFYTLNNATITQSILQNLQSMGYEFTRTAVAEALV